MAELDPLDQGEGKGGAETYPGLPRSDRVGDAGGEGLVCVSVGISVAEGGRPGMPDMGIDWQLMRRGRRPSSRAERFTGGAEVDRLGDTDAVRAAGVPGRGGGGA